VGRAILSLATAWFLVHLAVPGAARTLAERLRARGYEPVTEEGGVSVFRQAQSDTIRLVAEGRFAAPPERVRAALLDYERHVGCVARLAESRVLARDDDSLLVYQRLSLPVVADRDMTLRVTWGAEAGGSWIAYRAVTGEGPACPEGVVRLTRYRGRWQLRPADGGRATVARLSVDMDMGGSLPPRLAAANAGQDLPALYAAISSLLDPADAAATTTRR